MQYNIYIQGTVLISSDEGLSSTHAILKNNPLTRKLHFCKYIKKDNDETVIVMMGFLDGYTTTQGLEEIRNLVRRLNENSGKTRVLNSVFLISDEENAVMFHGRG